ncbi:hypothetical protein LXL04_028294 [Taraxacum kok-saghyz]
MNKLSGVFDLLKGAVKIISQNGKLMAITAAVYLILYSITFIINTSSTTPFIMDLTLKIFALISAHPGTPEYSAILIAIREDIGIFLGIETVYAVFSFLIAVFAQTTMIIIASSYYIGSKLSFKELIRKVSRTWTRPFVTLFYVQLLALGYMSFFFLPFVVPSLVLFDQPMILIAILLFLFILYFTFYLYLSVVWSLAVVVSVFEDTYGLSALGNARELVRGKRVDGILLNIFLNLVLVAIFMVGSKLSPAMPIVVGLIQVVSIGAGYVKSQKTPKFSIPSHFEFCPSTLQSALVPSQSVSHTHAALQSPTLSDTPLSNLASPDFASPNLAQTPPTSGSPLSDLAQTPRRRFPLIVANHQLRLLRNRLPAPPSPPCSDVPSLLRRPLIVPHLFLDALRQVAAITTCNSPHLLLIFDSFSGT